MAMKKSITLVEFTSRRGKTKNYINPEKVEAITYKNLGKGGEFGYVTVIMLDSGNYVMVDGTPEEAAERIAA